MCGCKDLDEASGQVMQVFWGRTFTQKGWNIVLRQELWSLTRNNKDASMTGIERPLGRGKEMKSERAVVRPGRTFQVTVTIGLLLWVREKHWKDSQKYGMLRLTPWMGHFTCRFEKKWWIRKEQRHQLEDDHSIYERIVYSWIRIRTEERDFFQILHIFWRYNP